MYPEIKALKSSGSSILSSFEFRSPKSRMIFEYLIRAFIEDYMSRRFARDDSGWRSLGEVAKETRISRSLVYPRGSNKTNSPLGELLRRGFVERRFFQGVRGRGGEVMKLRIAFENDLIRDYVEQKIKLGSTQNSPIAKALGETRKHSSLVEEANQFPDKNRIAVLPLLNISRDANDDYFADGLTEELISTLSKISGLKVIARTSVMAYKGKEKKIDEITRQLNVGTILNGSVRKEGQKIRVSVQLSDVSNSDNLWSETYDKELTDVFAIQSDISNQVANALRVRLPGSRGNTRQKIPTLNAEAYEMYLKGRYCFRNFYSTSEADFRRTIEYLERAVKLDPSYAEAYAWLSAAHSILSYNCWAPTDEVLPAAKNAAKKALELDQNSAEAYNATFLISLLSYDWKGCEDAAKKVLELNPNLIEFHELYHYYLLMRGRLDESLVEARKAQELDPLSTWANLGPPLVIYHQRDYDSAIEQFKRLLEFDPDSPDASQYLGRCYFFKSKYDEALRIFQRSLDRLSHRMEHSPSDDHLLADVACAYARLGREDEAREILRKFEETSQDRFVPPWSMFTFISLWVRTMKHSQSSNTRMREGFTFARGR